jgi:hypothetical protein
MLLARISFAQITGYAVPGNPTGQVVGGVGFGVPGAVSTTILSSSPTTSIADQSGNVIVFDVMYNFTPPPPVITGTRVDLPRIRFSPKTRVSVITRNGQALTPREYSAIFQIVGAGRNAVYAVVIPFPAEGQLRVLSSNPRLIALNFGNTGLVDLPADVSGFRSPADFDVRGPVQLVAPSEGAADTLFAVDPNVGVFTGGTGTAPSITRFVRYVNFDGANFSATTSRQLP